MSLFTPNTSTLATYYDKARFLLAWRVSVAFMLVFIVLVPIFSLSSSKAVVPSSIALITSSSCLLFLKFTKNFKPLFWVYSISGTLITHFAMNYVLEFTHYVDFLWMMAVILTAFVGLGRKAGILFIVLNSIGIAYFFWMTLNTHIEVLQPKTNLEIIGDFVEVCLALFVIAYLLHQYMLFNDYTEKKLKLVNSDLESQNKLIAAKNEENVTLVKEVHHRVKNNLQIITSLLRIQKADLAPEVEKKFDEAISRIMTMSLIHQKLYQEEELSKVELKSYILELSEEIKFAFQTKADVTIEVNSKVDSIGLKTIVPFGLLINELISNSFKHAFGEVDSGTIRISIERETDNQLVVKYSDNGIWKEPSSEKPHFGLDLIETLTEQLEGNFERSKSSYLFHLKDLDT